MYRILQLLWTAGFLVGATTHVIDLVSIGWLPYGYAPLWMNAYWTSLTFLDPLVVFLLWTRARYGIYLGVTVMVSDVVINSYASYGLGLAGFSVWLQLQSLFCGFVLGSAAHLLKRA